MYPKILEKVAPKVFISYSHDSAEQMDMVLSLSDNLRDDGIDCSIDQYEMAPMRGWHRWMAEKIEESDFVLMICTPQYIRRFRANEEDRMSMGIAWAGAIISQELYERGNSKYIPIVFAEQDADSIPNILRSSSRYNLAKTNGYELLYRHLTDQHKIPKPDIGVLQTLPVQKRKQFFSIPSAIDDSQEIKYCNLPHKKHGDFIGRTREILELFERISPDYRQHISVVRGIGGVGKTALVLEVAHQCWQAKKTENPNNIPVFDAIIFTSSKATDLVNTQIILNRPEKEPLLTDIFRVISDVLNEPTITQVLAQEQRKKANEALSKQSTLLIVDNMETLSESERNIMFSFLNNVPISTKVIITTRDFVGFDGILINSLTKQESFDLLGRQAKIKGISINNSWKTQVYNRFSGIPIALIYAVGKRAAGYNFADIIEPKRVLAEDLGKFCFESSVALIKETIAYKLLIAMPFFGKSSRRDALIKVAGLTDGNQDVISALAKLQQLSLITEEVNGRYSILSITREYAILELESEVNNDFNKSARERWYAWYLNFTQEYGGHDWDSWRARYDRIDDEWDNVQLVLNWYAEKADWEKVLSLWENLDNYADLSGYWQDRRYWWALLGKNYGSTKVKVKALSEKGLTLTLMGTEYYEEAEQYLNNAWNLCKDVDEFVKATVANHFAVLAKVNKDYEKVHYWLDIEKDLLETCQQNTREKKRYLLRNIYYRAETNYLQRKFDIAEIELDDAIKLSREIGWQRFRNYSKNILVEIYIIKGDLELAKSTLEIGISSAYQAKERRRIALYHASYARLWYHLAVQNKTADESIININEAKRYAKKAMKIFSKEFMLAEKNELDLLFSSIDDFEHSIQQLNSGQ